MSIQQFMCLHFSQACVQTLKTLGFFLCSVHTVTLLWTLWMQWKDRDIEPSSTQICTLDSTTLHIKVTLKIQTIIILISTISENSTYSIKTTIVHVEQFITRFHYWGHIYIQCVCLCGFVLFCTSHPLRLRRMSRKSREMDVTLKHQFCISVPCICETCNLYQIYICIKDTMFKHKLFFSLELKCI